MNNVTSIKPLGLDLITEIFVTINPHHRQLPSCFDTWSWNSSVPTLPARPLLYGEKLVSTAVCSSAVKSTRANSNGKVLLKQIKPYKSEITKDRFTSDGRLATTIC